MGKALKNNADRKNDIMSFSNHAAVERDHDRRHPERDTLLLAAAAPPRCSGPTTA